MVRKIAFQRLPEEDKPHHQNSRKAKAAETMTCQIPRPNLFVGTVHLPCIHMKIGKSCMCGQNKRSKIERIFGSTNLQNITLGDEFSDL